MTKQKELKIAWERYRRLPFPKHSKNNEQLYDLFADLVLIDSGAAGYVSSFLNGGKPSKERIRVDTTFNAKLEASKPTQPDDLKDWLAMKQYKDETDKLVTLLIAAYNE